MKTIATILICFLAISCSKNQKLVWEENFDGDSLNESVWNFDLGNGCPDLCGWGNDESQIYTKENYKLENGFLIITAKKEKNGNYTSTRITTKNKQEFKYGRIEIKAKLALGKGLWPALWMLGSNINEVGWPMCGEIDIVEYVGREPGTVFTSLHTKASFGNTVNTKKKFIDGIEEGFHLYEIDWNKNKIDFYIDRELFYSFHPKDRTDEIWPFDQTFYFIINLAIGGSFGGKGIDDSVFPQEFIIDYIKIYQ